METNCPRLLQNYLNKNIANGHLTEASVSGYSSDIMNFFRYLLMVRYEYPAIEHIPIQMVKDQMTDNDILAVTKDDVWGYVFYLRNDRKLKASSVKRRIVALSNFYKDLRDNEELLDKIPTEGVKIDNKEKKTPVFLTQDEWERLIDATIEHSSFKERDLCIITFLLNLGLRREELVQINEGDVKTATKHSYLHVHGKGRKERNVPLNDACIDAYKKCVAKKIKPVIEEDTNALFISKKGYRMSASAVYRMIKKMAKYAGLDPQITTHSLRHTFGTNAIRIGTINQVQKLMGHEDITTTTIYTHISDDGLEDIINKSPTNQSRQITIEEINKKKERKTNV